MCACSSDSSFNLSSVLKRYFADNIDAASECSKCITEKDGEGVCFLLDGLEDYSVVNKNDTFLYKLFKGEILSKSVVVVTSRPSAAVKFQHLATRQVEILGLSKTQIHERIRNYPFSKRNKAKKMSTFLENHPNILSMCYLEYQLEIIASLLISWKRTHLSCAPECMKCTAYLY